MITAVGRSSAMKMGANLVHSSSVLPGMHLLMILYCLDILRPTRCLGIESPMINIVLLAEVVGSAGVDGCCCVGVFIHLSGLETGLLRRGFGTGLIDFLGLGIGLGELVGLGELGPVCFTLARC